MLDKTLDGRCQIRHNRSVDDQRDQPKPLHFVVADPREALRSMPEQVRKGIGHALYMAQCGEKHADARPLKEYKGAGVLEIVMRHRGDTYRLIYTTRFERVIYVLHAFMKKSAEGIKTRRADIELVRLRLRHAEEDYHRLTAGPAGS